jgi:hypothetical protein
VIEHFRFQHAEHFSGHLVPDTFTVTGEGEAPAEPPMPPCRMKTAPMGQIPAHRLAGGNANASLFRYNSAMQIILTALAVTFAAFVVWLVVRFVNRRERWTRRLLIGIAASTPVLYVLSTGPATYLVTRGLLSSEAVDGLFVFYSPLRLIIVNGPEPAGYALEWYMHLWRPDEPYIDDPDDPAEDM